MSGISNIHLVGAKNIPQTIPPNSKTLFLDAMEASINNLVKSWQEVDSKSQVIFKNVPAQYKIAFQAQILMSKCQYQTEFITKVIDSVQSSIKKLQQQS